MFPSSMNSLQSVNLDEIDRSMISNPKPYYLLKQLALVSAKSEVGPITNAHEFINIQLEFDLNNPYIPTKEEYYK